MHAFSYLSLDAVSICLVTIDSLLKPCVTFLSSQSELFCYSLTSLLSNTPEIAALCVLFMFTGNTAPYHFTQPSTDNDVQIVSPTATMTSITCSLNITIPSTMIVTWSHNTSLITDLSQITTAGSTTTLLIENLQPSDAGVYHCVFNDAVGSGWTLRRNIRLFITGIAI